MSEQTPRSPNYRCELRNVKKRAIIIEIDNDYDDRDNDNDSDDNDDQTVLLVRVIRTFLQLIHARFGHPLPR